LSGIEKQGREIGRFAEFFDPPDENRVVATDMAGFVGHLEGGAATGEQRRAPEAGLPRKAGEAIDRPGREAVGEIGLPGGQDIDGVVAGAAEGVEVVRSVVEAPEHQRRLQRDGREGIDGQADRLSLRIERRDDGDAGREAPVGIAQGAAVVGGLGHWLVPA